MIMQFLLSWTLVRSSLTIISNDLKLIATLYPLKNKKKKNRRTRPAQLAGWSTGPGRASPPQWSKLAHYSTGPVDRARAPPLFKSLARHMVG